MPFNTFLSYTAIPLGEQKSQTAFIGNIMSQIGNICESVKKDDLKILFMISSTAATSHMWQMLSTSQVASVTKKLDFKFHLLFININFNSHMWLVAIVLDSAFPDTKVNVQQLKMNLKNESFLH